MVRCAREMATCRAGHTDDRSWELYGRDTASIFQHHVRSAAFDGTADMVVTWCERVHSRWLLQSWCTHSYLNVPLSVAGSNHGEVQTIMYITSPPIHLPETHCNQCHGSCCEVQHTLYLLGATIEPPSPIHFLHS